MHLLKVVTACFGEFLLVPTTCPQFRALFYSRITSGYRHTNDLPGMPLMMANG